MLPPLVLHIVYRFDTGGLENGVVNLLNHMPASAYRHAVLALTECAPAFTTRVQSGHVQFHALNKPAGHALRVYPQMTRLLRMLKPAIVHTRNLAALECQLPAWWSGVPARVHGEHGRDVEDLDGSNVKLQRVRRLYRPLVHRYVALSRDLQGYLREKVHVPEQRITQIYNGVDSQLFSPPPNGRRSPLAGSPFNDPGLCLIGTVGRMKTVKDQTLLARAFVQLISTQAGLRQTLRLVIVGDGPLRAKCLDILASAGMSELAWLPGERADVPDVMRALDCFVLPSLGEGISNTILEAMASGLPVLATDVGGNRELVSKGHSGELVAAGNVAALAAAIARLVANPEHAAAMGQVGRQRVLRSFSLAAMVGAYQGIYDQLLNIKTTGH